jgi:hypothetical protein
MMNMDMFEMWGTQVLIRDSYPQMTISLRPVCLLIEQEEQDDGALLASRCPPYASNDLALS